MFSKRIIFAVVAITFTTSPVAHAEVILRGQQQNAGNGLAGRNGRRQLMQAMETSPTPAPAPSCTIGGKAKSCGASGKAADECCEGYECVSSWCKKATAGFEATACTNPDDTTTQCYSPLVCQTDCDGNPTGICTPSSQPETPQSCSDSNAIIQDCDTWCKSADILDADYYLNVGFEGGMFSFVDEEGNSCSNNCGSEGGCCDHGVTPVPVQKCESWSVSGNTNVCEHGTSVNTLCRPGLNDCAGLDSKYTLTGIIGTVDVADGLCKCYIQYTEDGVAAELEVYNSGCALNFECGCGVPYCPE